MYIRSYSSSDINNGRIRVGFSKFDEDVTSRSTLSGFANWVNKATYNV